MWIFTRYGFFSVSVDRLGNLAVRARKRDHLQSLKDRFPIISRAVIIQTKKADYRYRLILSKPIWTNILVVMAEEQTWGNFKSEADRYQKDPIYKHALYNIWYEMVQSQTEWEEK